MSPSLYCLDFLLFLRTIKKGWIFTLDIFDDNFEYRPKSPFMLLWDGALLILFSQSSGTRRRGWTVANVLSLAGKVKAKLNTELGLAVQRTDCSIYLILQPLENNKPTCQLWWVSKFASWFPPRNPPSLRSLLSASPSSVRPGSRPHDWWVKDVIISPNNLFSHSGGIFF